jgi:large subunit ribosomal protein L20
VPRVKRGTHRRASRKKVLEQASGYFLTKSKLYRAAQEAVERGLKFAYVGRKLKKREYRSLWIVRINASCRAAGVSYSQFVRGLKAAGLDLNRKVLADIALHDEAGFLSLVQAAKAALDAKPGPETEPAPEGRALEAEPAAEAKSTPETEPIPEGRAVLEAEPALEAGPNPENAS